MLSRMNPFHHTFSFEPKVISYYENGKKAHPRGVCQSDKDTPLHSFHFQKIKKFVFLKVGDYIKTIKRSKYIDRIIELNGTPDIKIIFIDFMDLAYEKNQGITFLTRLCVRTLSGRQNELYKGVFLKTYKNYIT